MMAIGISIPELSVGINDIDDVNNGRWNVPVTNFNFIISDILFLNKKIGNRHLSLHYDDTIVIKKI